VGAPWRYDDEDSFVLEEGPSWACPDATCRCDASQSRDDWVEHRIVLFDENAERMPNARCRIRLGRRAINDDMPHADGSGTVVVRVPKHASQLLVEWAPERMPQEPLYPFRCRYFTNMNVEAEEATRRSLHNLGFSMFDSLEENVVEYLRSYKRTPSPQWERVAHEMIPFHDGGMLPPIPAHQTESREFVLAQHVDEQEQRQRLLQDQGDGPDGPVVNQQVPPPVNAGFREPNAGGAGNPPTRRLRIELRSAVTLTVEPNNFLRLIAGATVHFDGSALTPPVPSRSFTTDDRGRLDVVMPSSEGDVVITISPPARWKNPTGQVAGPDLTKDLRKVADAALDGVSDRRSLFKRRHDAEKRILELEKVRTALEIADASDEEIAAVEQELTDERRKLRSVREDLRARAHEASTKYAAAMPEFLFRDFKHTISLGPGGRVQLRTRRAPIGDPRFVEVRESPGRLGVRWFPDWVRSPAYRIAWQRPISESAMGLPEKGLGGDKMLVLHATGPRLSPAGDPIGPMTLEDGVANFSVNVITEQNSRPNRNDDDDVSVHYLVARSGHAVKLVDERFEAFHAGGTIWRRHKRVNARSVGIEILNNGRGESYTESQIKTVERLAHEVLWKFSVLPRNVVGHGELQMVSRSDASLSRARLTSDPGLRFPWVRLARQDLTFENIVGLPVHSPGPPATPDKIRRVKQKLLALGYTMSTDNRSGVALTGAVDAPFNNAYQAFQLRWHADPAQKPRNPTPPPDQVTADRIIAGVDLILSRPFTPRGI
jgi:N-acetyl-anhydromuramyl-L-alanine amidase AmpD